MAQFTHYLKTAFRNILKRKGQNSISIIGLAFSILCFAFCMFTTYFSSSLNYKVPNNKKIVRIQGFSEEKNWPESSWKGENLKLLLDTDIEGVASIGSVNLRDFFTHATYFSTSQTNELPLITNIQMVTETLPDIFSIRIIEGDKKEMFNTPNNVLLAESTAKKIYGDESPVGYTIRIKDKSYTIKGVMKDLPSPNSISGHQSMDIFICMTESEAFEQNGHQVYALLNGEKSIRQINREIKRKKIQFNNIIPKLNNDESKVFTPQGINEILLTFIIIGFLILGSGLLNFLSINITTFYNRNRELIIRKVIGSSFRNLFGLLFTEITILIVFAFLLSISLTEILLPVIVNTINFTHIKFAVPTPILIQKQLLYFVFTWIFCGIISYFAIRRLHTLTSIQGIKGKNYNRSQHHFRNIVLCIQFFVTILFVGTTIILQVQTRKVKREILPDFSVQEQRRTFIAGSFPNDPHSGNETRLKQLTSHPGIESVLNTDMSLLPVWSEPYKTNENKQFLCKTYSGNNFVDFFHLKMVSGDNILTEPNTVIISKSLFDEIHTDKYDGYLHREDISYRIIGIVEDFETKIARKNTSPYSIIKPVFSPITSYIKAYPGQKDAVWEHLKKIYSEQFPESSLYSYSIQTVDNIIRLSEKPFAAVRNVGLILSLICISLTLLGVYSAILLDTEKRQKEAGIRKANGATTKNIAIQFGKVYVYLYCIAFILSLPVLWFVCHIITGQFNIVLNFHNPLLWIGIFLSVLFIVLSMISYRIYKICHTNPADVIKTE